MSLSDKLSEYSQPLFAQLSRLVDLMPRPAIPRMIEEPELQGTVESFDGTQIFYECHGPQDSPEAPLVFCYGLVCSMNQWRAQLERYRPHRMCVLVDYRGHHRSAVPKNKASLNMSALAKDVARVIEHLQFKGPAHIWGHSMGVNVALELALAHPELCASLVLCCGTMHNPFESMFNTNVLARFAEPMVRDAIEKPELYKIIWRLILANPKFVNIAASLVGFNEKASKKEDTEAYAKAVANISNEVFFPLILEMISGQSANIVPKINTPALVVAGSRDFMVPPTEVKALASALPNGEFFEVPMGSHNVQLDYGDYVCLRAEEFWRKIEVASTGARL
jgi:pimeloyl-ACP methyl ester carboxylesterase